MTLGSLFDGSGTAPLCATLLGWEPLWASEIEPYPVAVTKARFPKMQHLGSITEINGAEIPPVDVIVGGSPCQDLSVAGKQAGLQDGTRSNLFYEMTRIIREMRSATYGKFPRFVVWENVPGAFSSNKGRDFLAVVEAFCALADDSVHIPGPAEDAKTGRLTWENAGTIVGDGWSFAWRVLDAQFWGVPQRRRRIFAVLDFGSERAGEILFERTRLPWDSEPRGETRESAAADAVGRADRGGGVRCLNPWDCQSKRQYDVNGVYRTLDAGEGAGGQAHGIVYPVGSVGSLCARADSSPCIDRGQPFVAYESGRGYWMPGFGCLRAEGENRPSRPSHCVIALQGNGIDRALTAGCNGAGWREGEMYTLNTIDRPAVVYSIDQQGGKGAANYDENVMCPILSSGHGTPHAVVFDARGNGDGDVAACITGDHQNRVTDYTNLAVFGIDARNAVLNEEITPTLQAKPNGGQSLNCMPPVLYCNSSRDDVAATLDASYYKGTGARNGKEREVVAMSVVAPTRRYIVRRLTPTECARLQGFPDWWTDGVPGSDTAKYKMWGNGMALPCVLAVLRGVGELERLTRRTCPTCAHHLGAEQCRINAEAECREGGGYELWEKKDA